MRVRQGAVELGAMLIVSAPLSLAYGQSSEAPPPPRIGPTPGGATLAAVEPPQEAEQIEEIVVIGEDRWRLPDLGSSWRAPEEERPPSRFEASFLPLYDPEAAVGAPSLYSVVTEDQRIRYIELFRLRFGTRD